MVMKSATGVEFRAVSGNLPNTEVRIQEEGWNSTDFCTQERSNIMSCKALTSLDLSNKFEKTSDIDASCLRQMLVVDISLDKNVVFMKCIAATCFTAPLVSNSPAASVDKLLQFTVRSSFVENLLKEQTIVDSDVFIWKVVYWEWQIGLTNTPVQVWEKKKQPLHYTGNSILVVFFLASPN